MCELIDPAHPDHVPGYEIAVLVASQSAGGEANFEALEAARLAWEALPPEQRRSGCCD